MTTYTEKLKKMDSIMFELPKVKDEQGKKECLKKIAPILRELGEIKIGADYAEIAQAYQNNLKRRIKREVNN